MALRKHTATGPLAASVALAALLVMAGCTKNESNESVSETPPPPAASGENVRTAEASGGGDTALITAGKAVFTAKGCANCHGVGGAGGGPGGGPPGPGGPGGPGGGRMGGPGPRPGGPGGGRRGGPNLSRVGAEAEHTSEWLIAHIKNPKTHNPSSRMPAFEGKISDKDLLALGAYLASLK